MTQKCPFCNGDFAIYETALCPCCEKPLPPQSGVRREETLRSSDWVGDGSAETQETDEGDDTTTEGTLKALGILLDADRRHNRAESPTEKLR